MESPILPPHTSNHIFEPYFHVYSGSMWRMIYIGYCVGDFMDQSWKHLATSTYLVLACSQSHDLCQPKGKLKNAIRLCDKTDLMNSQPLPHSQRGKRLIWNIPSSHVFLWNHQTEHYFSKEDQLDSSNVMFRQRLNGISCSEIG